MVKKANLPLTLCSEPVFTSHILQPRPKTQSPIRRKNLFTLVSGRFQFLIQGFKVQEIHSGFYCFVISQWMSRNVEVGVLDSRHALLESWLEGWCPRSDLHSTVPSSAVRTRHPFQHSTMCPFLCDFCRDLCPGCLGKFIPDLWLRHYGVSSFSYLCQW